MRAQGGTGADPACSAHAGVGALTVASPQNENKLVQSGDAPVARSAALKKRPRRAWSMSRTPPPGAAPKRPANVKTEAPGAPTGCVKVYVLILRQGERPSSDTNQ